MSVVSFRRKSPPVGKTAAFQVHSRIGVFFEVHLPCDVSCDRRMLVSTFEVKNPPGGVWLDREVVCGSPTKAFANPA